MVEYALLAALVALVASSAVTTLGRTMYNGGLYLAAIISH